MRARQIVKNALEAALKGMDLPVPEKLVIEEPKNAAHGDISVNAAMLLAKQAGMPPRELGSRIADALRKESALIVDAQVAGPGFCNLTLAPQVWTGVVTDIEEAGPAFGRSDAGAGAKVLVEYVSANPTGPLHVGHGRGAAVGDSVARILREAGYEVGTEYYLNDAGRQMRLLGQSIWLRALEISGQKRSFPDDCYKGGYIRDLAAELLEQKPELTSLEEKQALEICRQFGMEKILAHIREDLGRFRCEHQTFFSEKSLVENGAVDAAFASLAKSGRSFEKDGALWFGSSALGDDQDRVLRKSDGSLTYFATDIAYHHDKFRRGYAWLVDVWGADHHGYIPRMRGAIAAMGENTGKFSVLLIQLVNLLENGETVSMSTRAGEFVTLRQLMDEVGVDAARFLFLSRSCDSPLDFDLELARRRSLDNPVYYTQYAHARVCSLLRRAGERGIVLPDKTAPEILEALRLPEELAILRQLDEYENAVLNSAKSLAPHHISRYLTTLASRMHAYYARQSIIAREDEGLARARLALLRAAGQVLRNGLFLLGVSAPDAM